MAAPHPDSGEHSPTYRARGLLHRSRSRGSSDFGAIAGSWWGDRAPAASRPWHNPPRRRRTIPQGQTVAYERTKGAVARAAVSVLGADGMHRAAALLGYLHDVGHEALAVGADVLRFAPVAGLSEAARVLLHIWDSVEAVETNRMSCLRLTERCATILISIRQEIGAAGADVADTLRDPLDKLTDSFRRVEHFIQKQVSRPFLKRYLKREEDALKIAACDASLTDTVGLFGVAIQIRMLKEIHAHGHAPQTDSPRAVLAARAAHDAALDMADLYAAMRAALRTGSDVAMLDILQIQRGDLPEAMKTLQRALEDPRLSFPRPPPGDALGLALGGSAPTSPTWDLEQDAAFHREFLEGGLDALRRISGAAGESLPPWTITRWEVDREGRIGVGYFSDVFKGVWRRRQVAIKILAPTTPRKLFRRETGIWASLKHPHVLELLGASSAAGDPPWFFVSPYMRNGTLVTFLKGVAAGDRTGANPSPLQMMHEIAVGMAYLHRKDVLHGDLKANNVLIDDELRCVISDFGQSELRSEVSRLSHEPQPHGTLRWQAPEIMAGEGVLTPEADVYAFAIVCVEVLAQGELPWPHLRDDGAVRELVLRDDRRPPIPHTALHPDKAQALAALIERCWARARTARPPFDTVALDLARLEGRPFMPSPTPRIGEIQQQHGADDRPGVSPDLAPVGLPAVELLGEEVGEAPVEAGDIPLQRVVTGEQVGEGEELLPPPPRFLGHMQGSGSGSGSGGDSVAGSERAAEDSVVTDEPESMVGDESEVFVSRTGSEAEADALWDGYDSPLPRDHRVVASRNERRYRLLLQHDFHASLNLPLWEPTPVRLGAVGYLAKPSGTFVTLFNAYRPVGGMPSIYGYGVVREASLRQDRRTFAQTIVQGLTGLLTFGGRDGTFSRRVARRHSFPLRAGHKHAYLYTENTLYRYMINMDAAKAWFRANIKEILRLHGAAHNVQREDVFLVVGTLETHEWGLFVSHEHPDGQLHFNVFSDHREGQDWGSFSTDTAAGGGAGPEADAEWRGAPSVHASKISRGAGAGAGPADAVLLARLRFRPDVDEPTRL